MKLTNAVTFLLLFVAGLVIALGARSAIRVDPPVHAGEMEGMDMADEKKAPAAPVKEPEPKHPEVVIDLGNERCPVMGGKVDGETYVEWNGLRVGFCCPGCDGTFSENPEKALDGKKIEWRAAAAAVAKVNAAKGAERTKLLAKLEKTYRVVRGGLPKAVVVDLGNERCPVMGGKVDGKTYTIWNGLLVGHCCPGCTERFLANPEKALDGKKIEWREAARAAARANAADPTGRGKILADLKPRFSFLPRQPGLLIDLGNERCPVMGGKVDGKTYTEWNGLRIGHCCPGCSKPLLENPEKLLDKAKLEWREAAKIVALADNVEGDARTKLLADARKRFKVLREPAAE